MNLEELIQLTHKHGIQTAKEIREPHRFSPAQIAWKVKHLHALEALNKKRRQQWLEEEGRHYPTVMYDSTDLNAYPATLNEHENWAFATYIDGDKGYQHYNELHAKHPTAKHITIAVFASTDAGDFLDVETGDARPEQAPGWYWKRKNSGYTMRPGFYANLSTWPAVAAALQRSGIPLRNVRKWVAAYTYAPHCPVGYDGCQWTDKAWERNLDESYCLSSFWS